MTFGFIPPSPPLIRPPGPLSPGGLLVGAGLMLADYLIRQRFPKKPPGPTRGQPVGGGNNPTRGTSASKVVGGIGATAAEIYVSWTAPIYNASRCRFDGIGAVGEKKIFNIWYPGDRFQATSQTEETGKRGSCEDIVTRTSTTLWLIRADGTREALDGALASSWVNVGAASYAIRLAPVGEPASGPLPDVLPDPQEETRPGPVKYPPGPVQLPEAPKPKPLPPLIKPKPKPKPPGPKPDKDPDPGLQPEQTPPAKPARPKPGPGAPTPDDKPAPPPGTKPRPPLVPEIQPPKPRPPEENNPPKPEPPPQIDPATGGAIKPKPEPPKRTPEDQHDTKDGPVVGNGPQPTLEGIARELGRQEAKLQKLINRSTPKNGAELDLGDLMELLQLIADVVRSLTDDMPGARYVLTAACKEKGQVEPTVFTVNIPESGDPFTGLLRRLDALAMMIEKSQVLTAKTCGRNTSTPTNNVTVTAFEVIE